LGMGPLQEAALVLDLLIHFKFLPPLPGLVVRLSPGLSRPGTVLALRLHGQFPLLLDSGDPELLRGPIQILVPLLWIGICEDPECRASAHLPLPGPVLLLNTVFDR